MLTQICSRLSTQTLSLQRDPCADARMIAKLRFRMLQLGNMWFRRYRWQNKQFSRMHWIGKTDEPFYNIRSNNGLVLGWAELTCGGGTEVYQAANPFHSLLTQSGRLVQSSQPHGRHALFEWIEWVTLLYKGMFLGGFHVTRCVKPQRTRGVTDDCLIRNYLLCSKVIIKDGDAIQTSSFTKAVSALHYLNMFNLCHEHIYLASLYRSTYQHTGRRGRHTMQSQCFWQTWGVHRGTAPPIGYATALQDIEQTTKNLLAKTEHFHLKSSAPAKFLSYC